MQRRARGGEGGNENQMDDTAVSGTCEFPPLSLQDLDACRLVLETLKEQEIGERPQLDCGSAKQLLAFLEKVCRPKGFDWELTAPRSSAAFEASQSCL